MRFSHASSERSGFGRCGTTPMRWRTVTLSRTTSAPATCATPPVGITRVVSTPIVVVLPAPLGPMSPKNSPSLTTRSSPSSATVWPPPRGGASGDGAQPAEPPETPDPLVAGYTLRSPWVTIASVMRTIYRVAGSDVVPPRRWRQAVKARSCLSFTPSYTRSEQPRHRSNHDLSPIVRRLACPGQLHGCLRTQLRGDSHRSEHGCGAVPPGRACRGAADRRRHRDAHPRRLRFRRARAGRDDWCATPHIGRGWRRVAILVRARARSQRIACWRRYFYRNGAARR